MQYGNRRAATYGFTLIEMAVVLVIIGLLMGSVMGGRALIEAAEYRALRNEIAKHESAWHGFRARYRALPGDFAQASRQLGLAGTDGNGNGRVEGGPGCEQAAAETCRAWQHLRAGGFLPGDPQAEGPSAAPTHAYQARISGYFSGTEGNGQFAHKLLLTGIPGDVARRLADDLDDGRSDRGRISCVRGCMDGGWPDDRPVDVAFSL